MAFAQIPGQEEQTQQPAAPQGQAGGWGQWLQEPTNRAFLISAGLQMMVGGHGNMGQQLGVALGAGAEAATGTARAEQEQANQDRTFEQNDRALAQRGDIASQDRAGRESVARIGAESREQVANIRGTFSLQRATQAGARGGQELSAYQRIFNSRAQELERNNALAPTGSRLTSDQIMQQAADFADNAFSRFRQQGGSTGVGGATPPGRPAPSPAPGSSALAPAPGAAAPAGAARPPLDQLLRDAQFQTRMQTPEGREEIFRIRPDLRPHVERMMNSPSFRHLFRGRMQQPSSDIGAP